MSAVDGSLGLVNAKLDAVPSNALAVVGNAAVGATLLTVRANVVVTTCPLPSLAVIVTVCDCVGPSVVPNDQLHVPLFVPVFVTLPTDALIETLSPVSASEYVPVFVAVAPSFTVLEALSAATVGATLEFTKWAKASVRLPFVPPPLFEIHGVGEPGVRVPKSVLLSPFVQLLNVLPLVVVATDFKRTESPLPPNPGMLTVPLEALIATV